MIFAHYIFSFQAQKQEEQEVQAQAQEPPQEDELTLDLLSNISFLVAEQQEEDEADIDL